VNNDEFEVVQDKGKGRYQKHIPEEKEHNNKEGN